MSDPQTISEFGRNAVDLEPLVRDELYEVVDGQVVEQEPMGAYEVWIASFLITQLDGFARQSGLGRGVMEMLFRLSDAISRRPDVAYVSYQRWPRDRRVPRTSAWNVVPDLAVEVISPSNTFEEVVGKVNEYFRAGVTRVWIISPSEQRVYVYRSSTDIEVATTGMDLRDQDLLPGLSVSIDNLFDVSASDEG